MGQLISSLDQIFILNKSKVQWLGHNYDETYKTY